MTGGRYAPLIHSLIAAPASKIVAALDQNATSRHATQPTASGSARAIRRRSASQAAIAKASAKAAPTAKSSNPTSMSRP